MRVCIIPMKRLDRSKERLADLLSPSDRRLLSLAMLRDVAAAAGPVMDQVWVLNSDEEAADAAVAAGAISIPDVAADEGLNASVAAATERALAAGVTGLLVLSADCPAIQSTDVRDVCVGPGIALAPDRWGTGTNAIWRRPPDAIPTVYGERSRRAHESLAHVRRIPCVIRPLERIALDIDVPADLALLASREAGAATTTVLGRLGYPSARR